MTGNKCGHDKLNPRFYARPYKKDPYWVIKQACDSVKNWYSDQKKFLPNLQYIREHDNKRRSESREAISAFLGAALNHTDLLDNRIVVCTPDGKKDMTLQQIGKAAGLGKRRTLRVFKALRESRYIEVEYQSVFDPEQKKWLHNPAIKRIASKLFHHLGIAHQRLVEAVHYLNTKAKPFVTKVQEFAADKAREKCMDMVKQLKAKFKNTTGYGRNFSRA
jgi:hypothetical protein